MTHLIGYLEQDDFNVECFVERLARNTLAGRSPESGEDADVLSETFKDVIALLKQDYSIREKLINRCEKSNRKCTEEYGERMDSLLSGQRETSQNYRDLQIKMDGISAKTVELSHLLEAKDVQLRHCLEADIIIQQLDCLMTSESKGSDRQLLGRCMKAGFDNDKYPEHVLKLYLAINELPAGQYEQAKERIAVEYSRVESDLLAQLATAQRQGDIARMREIIELMSNFRGYHACVDQFIVNAQKKTFIHPDIFLDIVPVCNRVARVAAEVFPHPETVLSKFVDNVIKVRVKDYINNQLQVDDTQLYLKRLHQLFTRTTKLCEDLKEIPMEKAYSCTLHRTPRELFQPYLRSYIALEYRYMDNRLDTLIRAYYQSVGHHRKSIVSTSPLKDFRREIQSKIKPKAAAVINLAPSVKDFGGETFICEALAVNVLQEMRESFSRTALLLREPESSRQALVLWQLLLRKFSKDHLLYGVNLGIKTIPVSQDLNREPKQYFLRSAYQTNAICHLVEDLFREVVSPLVDSTVQGGSALKAKKESAASLEEVIRVGLKRSMKAYVAWISVLLDRQRYDEFCGSKSTKTSQKVVAFANNCVTSFEEFLDGQNKETVLMEFGRRFHKSLMNHIHRFQYNQDAGLGLLCDVAEYRAVIQRMHCPILARVFGVLHQLCSILIVPAENILDICGSEELKEVDEQVLKDFVQLRADCKSSKLLAVIFHDCG